MLTAPSGYKIQVADCYHLDCNEDRQELESKHHPTLDETAGTLTWKLPYIKAAKLFVLPPKKRTRKFG